MEELDVKRELERELAGVHLSGERRAAIRRAMERPPAVSRRRPVRMLLAAVLACAALGTAALALSPTLRERMNALLGSFAPYSQTVEGVSAVDQGIEIRAVRSLSDGNQVWIYLEARDLEGARLSLYTELEEDLGVLYSNLDGAGWTDGEGFTSTCLRYDEESGAALFQLQFTGLGAPEPNDTFTLAVDSISPEVRRGGAPLAQPTGETLESEVLSSGEIVLTPEQTPQSFLETDLFTLSSYGFGLDGVLHVQLRLDGEELDQGRSTFRVQVSSLRYQATGATEDYQTEARYNRSGEIAQVFFQQNGALYCDIRTGVTPADLPDAVVEKVYGTHFRGETLEGDWTLEIPLEDVPVRTVRLDNGQTLTLSALGCTAESWDRASAMAWNGVLTIYLQDGTVQRVEVPSGHTYPQGTAATVRWSFNEPIDPEKVTAVAFGQRYLPIKADNTAGPGRWLESLPE